MIGDSKMPLLDTLFGKKEYPQQHLQPATIPIKSLVQPVQQQPPMQASYPDQPFLPPAMMAAPSQQQFYPHTPTESELQRPIESQSILPSQPQERAIFSGGAEAPVFVKIERYEEVLTELSAIKADIENFKAAVAAFENLRDLQAEIIGVINGVAKDIERSYSKLDKILVEMQAVRERVKAAAYEEKSVEKPASVTDLEERIKRLRQEISRLEVQP